MTAVVSDDPEIMRAVTADRLSAWADAVLADPNAPENVRADAVEVRATCSRIRATNESERDRLDDVLRLAQIRADRSTVSSQRHTIRFDVEPDEAARAATVIEAEAGYRPTTRWMRGAARSSRRFASEVRLTHTGSHTSVVRLRWRTPVERGRVVRAARAVVVPTPADWHAIELPSRLWWLYSFVRPMRLVCERIGLASPDHASLEPFLATPDDLLDPLFDLGDVDQHDLLADIGCGDGRVVVEAARRRSCRALGIEQSSELAEAARDRVDRAGMSDRVRIAHGDAAQVAVDDVTVVVLFLPMVVARRLLPDLLGRLRPGARVLLHEQSPLPAGFPAPSSSHTVVADEAATVVHRWVVGAGDRRVHDDDRE